MAYPVDFPGKNLDLQPPPGAENIAPLPIFRNGTCCVSCWELSPDELADVIRTGKVFLSVFWGQTQPPVYVGSEETTREVIADYGVWKR